MSLLASSSGRSATVVYRCPRTFKKPALVTPSNNSSLSVLSARADYFSCRSQSAMNFNATFHPHDKVITDNQATFLPSENATEKTICGLRRTTFGLIAVIVILIIAGSVGGGVGCSIAVKQKTISCNNGSVVDIPQRHAWMFLSQNRTSSNGHEK